MKMHADEVDIDADLVRGLLIEQFPHLAALPITRFSSAGTVNAIYRLGDRLYARLPRVARWAQGLENECRWLPVLAPRLSLRIPVPVAKGRPTRAYPFSWAIFDWIDGEPYADERVADECQAARDLARFVVDLRAGSVDGAPPSGRAPLRELDEVTRAAVASARGAIDGDGVLSVWAQVLEAPAWQGTPVWIHTDLLQQNLLVRNGRLHAVIDFGAVGVGDPAADVIAAWSVFTPVGRAIFRDVLQVEDGMWNRACGFALHQAVMLIPYYRETNPRLAAAGVRTIDQILTDVG